MYEPRLQAEALSEACGVPTVRLNHAARFRSAAYRIVIPVQILGAAS